MRNHTSGNNISTVLCQIWGNDAYQAQKHGNLEYTVCSSGLEETSMNAELERIKSFAAISFMSGIRLGRDDLNTVILYCLVDSANASLPSSNGFDTKVVQDCSKVEARANPNRLPAFDETAIQSSRPMHLRLSHRVSLIATASAGQETPSDFTL